jgi:hypothetical protein
MAVVTTAADPREKTEVEASQGNAARWAIEMNDVA